MNDTYASLFTRVKAAVVDSIVLMVLIYGAAEIFNFIGQVPDYTRIVAFILIFCFITFSFYYYIIKEMANGSPKNRNKDRLV